MSLDVRVIVLAGVVSLLGCENSADRPAEWPYIHAAIIVPSCATASCHSSLTVRAGIALEDEAAAHELLVSERFVVPGDLNSPCSSCSRVTSEPPCLQTRRCRPRMSI